MKKILAILLVLVMMVSLVACGGTKKEEKEEGGLKAEKKIINVEVTIPNELLGEDDDATLTESMKKQGIKKVTKNEDGSLTYKMSKSAHKKMLEGYKKGVDEGIVEILEDKENYASFESITYNADMTEFTINVDKGKFTDWDTLISLTFYMQGWMYQAFNFIPAEELRTVVKFVDQETGKVLETGDSKALEENEEKKAN